MFGRSAKEAAMPDWALITQLVVLLNPLSSFPFLLSAHRRGINVRRLAVSAVLTAYAIAAVVALIGPYLFNVFGVTADSFRIAGGIVLLLLGIEMIRSQDENVDEKSSVDGMIAIIASPLLTGPATISFVTIKTQDIGLRSMLVNLSLAFVAVAGLLLTFAYSVDRINERLVSIASRVFGLFLTAVAIEMIAAGLTNILLAMRAHP